MLHNYGHKEENIRERKKRWQCGVSLNRQTKKSPTIIGLQQSFWN